MTTEALEEYLMMNGHSGAFSNTTHNCLCDKPKVKNTVITKPAPPTNPTVDLTDYPINPDGSVNIAEQIARVEEARSINTTNTKNPSIVAFGNPLEGLLDSLGNDFDIVNDVVVRPEETTTTNVVDSRTPSTTDNGIVITEEPTNLSLIDNAKSKLMGGGWIMWVLVAAGIGLALKGSNETEVVEI